MRVAMFTCVESCIWSPPCMQIPAPLTNTSQLSNIYINLGSTERQVSISITETETAVLCPSYRMDLNLTSLPHLNSGGREHKVPAYRNGRYRCGNAPETDCGLQKNNRITLQNDGVTDLRSPLNVVWKSVECQPPPSAVALLPFSFICSKLRMAL